LPLMLLRTTPPKHSETVISKVKVKKED